jgi:hypothetical protein
MLFRYCYLTFILLTSDSVIFILRIDKKRTEYFNSSKLRPNLLLI